MESIAFDLKLMDSVTSPARRAAAALAQVEARAKKAQESLNFEKEIGKAEGALKKLTADPKGFVALNKAQKELREQRNKLLEDAGVKKPESFFSALTSRFSFAKLASAAAVGELMGEGVIKVGEALIEGAKKAVEIFEEGLKKAFEEAGKEQTLRLGEKLSLGKGAGEFREDVSRFSKLTGFSEDPVRSMLLRARRAGFSQQAARSAFAAAGDIAAGEGQGGNLGRVQELLEGFTHIKLKGGITERQLPGLGVDVKAFYTSLSKALGIDQETAKKRAQEGKVDPQLLLNTIFKQIEQRQGGKLGTGTVAYSQTFEARIEKIKNLPNEYLKNLVESPGFAKATDAAGRILEKLDPESESGQKIIASLERMFDKIIGWVDEAVSPEGLDHLVEGIKGAVELLEKAVSFATDLVDMFKKAAEISSTIAKPFEYVYDKMHGGETGNADLDTLKDRFNKGQISQEQLTSIVSHMSPRQVQDVVKRQGIHITVTNHNTFHGVDDKTAGKVADETHRATTHAVERASQEAG